MNENTTLHTNALTSLATYVEKAQAVTHASGNTTELARMIEHTTTTIKSLPWGNDEDFEDLTDLSQCISDELSERGYTELAKIETANLIGDLNGTAVLLVKK